VRLIRFPLVLATLALSTATPVAASAPSLPTVVSLTSAANPATQGQPLTLTATVAGPGWPSGTVTFSDYEFGLLETVPLTGGAATVTVPMLSPGLHLIAADYAGDTTFAPSSARLTQRVGEPMGSRVELNVDHNPSPPGQALALTATLVSEAGFGTATGTLTFMDGPSELAVLPVSLLASPSGRGVAADQVSLPTSSLAAGVHNLTAIYSGDGNFKGSTSATWTQVVGEKVATTTTLSSTANPSLGGQAATLTAAVAPLTPASRQPSGSLTFRDGGTVLGRTDVASGSGSLSVSLVSAGAHDLTVAYSGDADFQESTSTTFALQVLEVAAGPTATATTLTIGPNPVSFGQPVTARASVTPRLGSKVPVGSVYFVDDSGAVLGGAALDPAGQGLLTLSSLPAGSHRIRAVYAGADSFAHSSSDSFDLSVERASVFLAPVAATSQSGGEPVALAVAVSVQGGSAPPSGSVTFLEKGAELGSASLGGDGRASMSTAGLQAGPHHLTAVYNGDADYASSSMAFSVLVPGEVPTSTSVRASQTRLLPARDLTVTATVATRDQGGDPPGGSVTFREGEDVLGVGRLDEQGVARLTLPALSPGSHHLLAEFSGGGSYSPSSASVSVHVLSNDEPDATSD
jgi:Bacterial Ig-like domain (group 3)